MSETATITATVVPSTEATTGAKSKKGAAAALRGRLAPVPVYDGARVIKGKNGQEAELTGAIEFLDPSGQEVLGSVDLFQVGIFSLSEDKAEAGKDAIARCTAELYVEKMQLNLAYV